MGNTEDNDEEENTQKNNLKKNFKYFKFQFKPSFKEAEICLNVFFWEEKHRKALIKLEQINDNLEDDIKFKKIRISNNLLFFF